MTNSKKIPEDFLDALAPIVDGEAEALENFADTLAESEEARDLQYEAQQAAAELPAAGADYEVPADMEARVLAAIDARSPYAPKPAPIAEDANPTAAEVGPSHSHTTEAPDAENKPQREGGSAQRRVGLWVGASFALAAAAVIGVMATGEPSGDDVTLLAGEALEARVVTVARASDEDVSGLSVLAAGSDAFAEAGAGTTLTPGTRVRTDERTRAELHLSDGSRVILNHATEVVFVEEARTLRLEEGELVAEVARLEEGPRAVYATPNGNVEVLGTKFVLVASESASSVRVTRGAVQVQSAGQSLTSVVQAGQEGLMSAQTAPVVTPATRLAESVAWSELGNDEGDDLPVPGIGELRARRPGEREDQERPLHLADHRVSVRIVGNVARTEIEERFQNDSPHTLEGIYRFPLPPDARIASLKLEVEGEWEEGAFVERARAQKIWRGVIRNATPQRARRQVEEIIWVPGPWRDPALLEWQRGGRFELRIFPIPARGSRRIRVTYEQTISPHGDMRRYVYPLAFSADESTRVGNFEVDVRVAGATETHDVQSRSYEMESAADGEDARRLSFRRQNFLPAGDLIIDYRRPHHESELSYWTFDGVATAPPGDIRRHRNEAVIAAQNAVHADQRPYVAFALRPELPAWTAAQARDYVLLVDSSQSMVGERFERAMRLVSGVISEMDRRDRFTVMACDLECQTMNEAPLTPSVATADQARAWLSQVEPAGSSNMTMALREAANVTDRSGEPRDVRVLYFGDGLSSTGARRAGTIAAEVRQMGDERLTFSTVGIGADADSTVLSAVARAGSGHYLPFVPGERTHSAALAVLESTYGVSLTDVTVDFPDGVQDVAPRAISSIRAGEEILLVGRLRPGAAVVGEVTIRGQVAGQVFSNRYPVNLRPSTAAGNAFVPRLWATKTIEELELMGRADDHPRIIALSRGYGVMSRMTSLLVLESEAMFQAFGLDRSRPTLEWTGEEASEAGESDGLEPPRAGSVDSLLAGTRGGLSDVGGIADSRASRASASVANSAPLAAGPRAEAAPSAPRPMTRRAQARRFMPPPGIPMRRVWYTEGQVRLDGLEASAREQQELARAEEAFAANPNSRDRHRELVRVLSRVGQLDRARAEAERWVQRDRLDPEALTYLADALGRLGERDRALRLLSGVVDLQSDNLTLHRRLANAFERVGRTEDACAHRVAMAEIDANESDTLADALRCLRGQGRPETANQMLEGAPDNELRERAERSAGEPVSVPPMRGHVLIDAFWAGVQDLDVSLITSQGTRLSWMGGRTQVVAEGNGNPGFERLGLRRARPGSYRIEVSRTDATDTEPISGNLRVNVLGRTRNIPFTLVGERLVVGRALVIRRSRLEPVRRGAVGRPGGRPGLRW